MKHRHSEFKSRGKKGRVIDLFLAWLAIIQICLIAWKLGDPTAYPWWLALVPLYIFCIPLLLIIFGVSQATKR